MDGHEIIEVSYKKLAQIIDYRIEAEYFSKKFIKNEQLLSRIRCKKFNKIANAVNGRAYSSEAFSQDGDLYISKIGDVTNKRGVENWDKLSIQEFENQKGEYLTDGDILMTLTGDPPDVGKVNLLSIEEKECTWNQRVAKITTLTDDYCSNYALYAVLSSELCRVQMERFAKGIRQRNLGNDCFGFVDIPVFGEDLQRKIECLIKKHIRLQEQAKNIYLEAECELKNHMGIIQETHTKPCTIKLFKESFDRTGRFDSEYYQPKYEKYKAIVQNSKLGFTFVKTEFSLVSEKCDKKLSQYPYVEIGDIDVATGTAAFNTVLTEDLPDNAKIMTKKNDILVSTVRPNRGAVAILEEDDLLVSGAFTVLREKSDYPKEVLQVLLRSEIYRDWMLRYNVGTSYPVIKDEDILNLPIPVLDEELKKEIVNNVQESFRLRKKSKELLDMAVKAVEMAIETDEQTALAWLVSQNI